MFETVAENSNITRAKFRNCIIFFFVLSFLIFGKSIENKFAMDDEYVVYQNQQVQKGIKAIPEIFTTTYAFGQKSSYEYRPVVKALYAIEFQIFGENTKAFHTISILLYTLLICYLFYTLLKLLPRIHYFFSLVVCTLFLVHPLHSEVVMSLKNLDVILSFFFSLLALNLYMKYADTRKIWYIGLGLLAMLLAFMSKRDSVPFIVIIPMTLWFFRNVSKKDLIIVTSSLVFSVIAFVQLAALLVSNKPNRNPLFWENPLYFNTKFWDRIPQGMHSVYFYIKMFLFPHPLVSYYGYNQVPLMSWSDILVWVMILFIVVVLYYVFKNFKTKNIEVYAILYFLISISMFTNVVIPVVGIVAERFAFIPSLGLCLLAAYALFKLFKIPAVADQFTFKKLKGGFVVTALLILLLSAGGTYARNKDWYDAYTLYKADAEKADESAHAHSLLAAAAVAKVRQMPQGQSNSNEKRKLVQEAEAHYLESLRILPDYVSSLNNLGMVYYTFFNKPDKAIPLLEKATQLDPGYTEAYFNLATCYAAINRFAEAEKAYKRSLEINPQFGASYTSLSNMYAQNKEYDKILSFNQAAIDKGLNVEATYINIGNVHYMNGDTLKALPYLEKAIELNSNNKVLNSFLANYYQSKGNSQKASYYYNLLSKSLK